ncbi:MAG: hypothetical protein ACK55I_00035 [bacterium]
MSDDRPHNDRWPRCGASAAAASCVSDVTPGRSRSPVRYANARAVSGVSVSTAGSDSR